MRNRISVIAQFDNVDLVSHVEGHLIVVNRKHGYAHISTVIEAVECGTRYVVII